MRFSRDERSLWVCTVSLTVLINPRQGQLTVLPSYEAIDPQFVEMLCIFRVFLGKQELIPGGKPAERWL